MSVFSYKAVGNDGKKLSGLVEAPAIKVASDLLRKKGLFIVEIKAHRELFSSGNVLAKFSRAGFNEVFDFTRQLSIMINAGLSLTTGLSILKEQSTNSQMEKVIGDIKRQVEGGSSFADAIRNYPKLFSSLYVSLIQAGEAAGRLDSILKRLADNLERSHEFRGTVKGALIYPILLIFAMGIVMAIMMIFVIPKLASLYGEFDLQLPLPTRILIATSNFSTNYWWVVLLGIASFVILFVRLKNTKAGRKVWDRVILSIPVLGSLRRKVILTEFTRTLGILTSSGVPVLDALNLITEAMDNVYYQEAIKEISAKVEKGSSLAEPMKHMVFFPPIVSRMVAIGEETGKLDETLLKVSHYFEIESQQTTKTLTTIMEPLILVIFGIGVGFLVWAVLSPIYQLMGQF